MMKTGEVLRIVEGVVPTDLAKEWDNSGLQVGNLEWPAKGVIVSLDADLSLLDKAKSCGANIAITHHPLIFNPVKRLDLNTPTGKIVERAIKDGVTIYAAHTNLDAMEGGVNDTLACKIGIRDIRPFADIGRIGELPSEEPVNVFIERLKTIFAISSAAAVGASDKAIRRVAVCGGSGGSLIPCAVESGADALVTGDVKYHAAKEAEAYGLAVIDIGHFASESVMLPVMASLIKDALIKEGIGMDIHIHDGSNPLRFY